MLNSAEVSDSMKSWSICSKKRLSMLNVAGEDLALPFVGLILIGRIAADPVHNLGEVDWRFCFCGFVGLGIVERAK